MKQLAVALGGAASVFAFVGSAVAADLPVKAAPPAEVVAPLHNWTGFYLGGNAGAAWSAGDVTYTVDPYFAGAPVGTPNGDAGRAALAGALTHVSDTGFTGGVQVGYNWQFNNIVLGIEADFDALSLNNSADTAAHSGTPVPWIDDIHTSIKTDWLLTVRPRIGVSWNRTLLYVTGGLAVTQLKTFQSQSNNDVFGGGFFPGYTESVSGSKTQVGWTVGGGLEFALWNHWSVKGEYLYTDFGSVSLTGVAGPPTSFGFGGQSFTHTFDLHTNLVRAGINYKF